VIGPAAEGPGVAFAAELDVSDRDVVVVGGSAEALGTIANLLQGKARVTVISPEVAASIGDLAGRGLITWLPRSAEATDYIAAALVVAATGSGDLDAEVRAVAARRNRLTVAPRWAAERVEGRPSRGSAAVATSSGSVVGSGSVVLVGGGPGDPGLLTVAGLGAIRTADVIVCDRLAPLAALEHARADAEIIDVGKIPRGESTPQARINALLIEQARRGRRVVRFKGGDSFVFGRGGEEWQACTAAGIAVEVIPGVSSAIAGPALAGIPLTHRQLTQGFTVVSGHVPPGDPGSTLDWAALARANTTLVVMMGMATLGAIAGELISQGLDPNTPAATVTDAGLPSQRAVRGNVSTIAGLVTEGGLKAPAITVIGAVAGFDPHE
jgi:uroporphyrin-III C-methyltransferase